MTTVVVATTTHCVRQSHRKQRLPEEYLPLATPIEASGSAYA